MFFILVQELGIQIKRATYPFLLFPFHLAFCSWDLPWWYSQHIVREGAFLPCIAWWVNLHYLSEIHLKNLIQFSHERIYSFLITDNFLEYDKTCMDIFSCYENMNIIILWYMSQIKRICIISILVIVVTLATSGIKLWS